MGAASTSTVPSCCHCPCSRARRTLSLLYGFFCHGFPWQMMSPTLVLKVIRNCLNVKCSWTIVKCNFLIWLIFSKQLIDERGCDLTSPFRPSASVLLLNPFLPSEIQKVSFLLFSSNLCAFEKVPALSLCNETSSWTWKKTFLVQAYVTLSTPYWDVN